MYNYYLDSNVKLYPATLLKRNFIKYVLMEVEKTIINIVEFFAD